MCSNRSYNQAKERKEVGDAIDDRMVDWYQQNELRVGHGWLTPTSK